MSSAGATAVLVVGGGVAGCSAAIALARAGVATTVIERASPTAWRVGETLPPSARPLLEDLGVWERFVRDGHAPSYGNSSAWGQPSVATTDFVFDPYGSGWHLDRRRFDALLVAEARESGVVWRAGTTLAPGAARQDGAWRLQLVSELAASTITAQFVIDASGRSSSFARENGARRQVHDRMVAVAGLLGPAPGVTAPEGDSATLIESVEAGWWYSAPLPDGRVVAAYFTDPDLLPVRQVGTAGAWAQLLQATVHTRRRIEDAGVSLLEPPRARAAGSSRLDRAAGKGWLAVGDAAASLDPLSSQGIMSAIASARSAVEAVLARLGGDGAATGRYDSAAAASYARYLLHRRGYYRAERRWPASPFWQRRWSLPPAVAPMTSSADRRPQWTLERSPTAPSTRA